jgi:DNA-binding response OmpR family regulator
MTKRVLVVDDHAPTRTLIRSVFDDEKTEQFEVFEATTGTECLKIADKHGPFDLILLDVNLPDIDGYSVCRALRRVDGTVSIVFVTVESGLNAYSRACEAGGDSYLLKPVARASLRSVARLFTSIKRAKRSDSGSQPQGVA